VRGVHISKSMFGQSVCKICNLGKITNQIFRRKSDNRAAQPFWRVRLDLFTRSPAYNGHRYSLIISDEYTGYIFHWFITSKTAASLIIQDFITAVKRQLNLFVCKIRMDNETSLINQENHRSSEFQAAITAKGIIIEPTPTHTKEPNGGGERAGRMVGEKLRAMMAYANLPLDLWPEAADAATYLHNITPAYRLGWKSPKEALMH
jgi:transposase InsO family protein